MRIEYRVSSNEMTSGEEKNAVHRIRSWLLSKPQHEESDRHQGSFVFVKNSIVIVAR